MPERANKGKIKFRPPELNDREYGILEAVISSYITTAKPVGSRFLSRNSVLGLSPASIRNTMSDLEEKGYLEQPFPSAGRVPTDKAYRLHVDNIIRLRRDAPRSAVKALSLIRENPEVEKVLHRTAEALSVVTQELGIGIEPLTDEAVLEGVELVRLNSERVMLVLTIGRGMVKTIFVELDSVADEKRLEKTAARLRERLTGLTLSEIRRTAVHRLRDAVEDDSDPLNIFVQSADSLFELGESERTLFMGETSRLASQPEFSDQENLRSLISLTDRKSLLLEIMRSRAGAEGLQISIGSENERSELSNLTLVTDTYRMGNMKGIIGVIGPTRMGYRRVISIVEYTSLLLSQMLDRK